MPGRMAARKYWFMSRGTARRLHPTRGEILHRMAPIGHDTSRTRLRLNELYCKALWLRPDHKIFLLLGGSGALPSTNAAR